ncbi:MAG: S4 domain-containing protein [Desulfobulbaceae bacterium]|jgi:ribosome-associated heat shock protein Hsp15|nr:S4 domain-containing protein [Desulfobulbaceae bacterium]
MIIPATDEKVRIDKWLWAARFFKTRSMAAKAVSGGHVHVNGSRVKPARLVQAGDTLHIRRGLLEFEVIVLELSSRRGPAVKARALYEETGESIQRRERDALDRRLVKAADSSPPRRPDKRERRKIRKFLRKD